MAGTYNKKVRVSEGLLTLESLREKDAYLYYTGYAPILNKKFKSPFVKEKNPSFVFYESYDDRFKYQYKCYSTGKFGRIVNLVMDLFKIDYFDAVKKLINDGFAKGSYIQNNYINSIIPYSQIHRVPEHRKIGKTNIEVVLRDYNEQDLMFWNQYGLNEKDLNEFDVKPCKEVWVESKKFNDMKVWVRGGLVYRYLFGDRYKIYNPFNKNNVGNWLSNTTINSLQGFKQLPDKGENLIITKSYKDVMVLSKYFNIPSIAFQSENSIPRKEVMDHLMERFKNIMIFYDNDNPGIEAAEKFSGIYKIPFVYIPVEYGSKDPSDLYKDSGEEIFIELINNLLNVKQK